MTRSTPRLRAARAQSARADRAAAARTTQIDARWAQVLQRDRAADGHFVYAVSTTGVYCRPSCPSRTARPEHVTFHATPRDAERAGFRACKRCRPDHASADQTQVLLVTRICRIIESSNPVPPLAALAAEVGVSPSHFHRLFTRITGVTPKEYARAPDRQRVTRALRQSGLVTSAIYEAGFPSSSSFYRTADTSLGMTPSAFKAGGLQVAIRFACRGCSLGHILVAASARGLCAIFLGDDATGLIRDLHQSFPNATQITTDPAFTQMVDEVIRLVDDPSRGLSLPLDIRGTVFQQRVWKALRDIPGGTTASYSDIAQMIGSPTAARAVAGACAANVLAMVIPCHRVVRGTGALSGYRWGVERKRALLNREQRHVRAHKG